MAPSGYEALLSAASSLRLHVFCAHDQFPKHRALSKRRPLKAQVTSTDNEVLDVERDLVFILKFSRDPRPEMDRPQDRWDPGCEPKPCLLFFHDLRREGDGASAGFPSVGIQRK